jgi:hypothetical protein
MSIKIFRGFKFSTTDLFEIHAHLAVWRLELRELHRQAVAAYLAKQIATMIDGAAATPGKYAGKAPYSSAYISLMERQIEIKKTGYRDPEIDFQFDVVLMPHVGAVYGMVFTEQEAWWQLFESKAYISDFSYWNNSDGPDDLPEEEWDRRGEVWSAILDAALLSVPAMGGFTAECVHETIHTGVPDVLAAIPSFEDRVKAKAFELAISAIMQEEATKIEDPQERSSLIFGMVMRKQAWLRSEEGRPLLAEYEVKMRTTLVETITTEMLHAELPADPLPSA